MKYIILMCLFLTGCGVAETIGKDCGGTMKMGCHAIFGGERDNDQDTVITDNTNRIVALEQQTALLMSVINSYGEMLATLEYDTTHINNMITTLQTTVNQNTTTILSLQSNHNITKIVDPCGNGVGFDEVFMRTSTGKLIASFSANSSGLNTRFVELTPGSYATTDGTGCSFVVGNDMSVTPSVEY